MTLCHRAATCFPLASDGESAPASEYDASEVFREGAELTMAPLSRQLAMRTLTLTFACLLSAFDIRAPIDPSTGKEARLDDTAFHTDSLSR